MIWLVMLIVVQLLMIQWQLVVIANLLRRRSTP
jgi:hypothetical protein